MAPAPPQHKQLRRLIKPYRVEPGARIRLGRDCDPAFKPPRLERGGGELLLERGIELLAEYQAKLAAQGSHGVLVVLQAMDAAGKDGTIKHVMSGVNPQGVRVQGFKVPSAEELDHDFLWRYQCALPPRGMIAIFNRSHYEEVLVVRVHPELLGRQKLPPESAKGAELWAQRYRAINDWERHLVENGIRVVKLFLNVSKEQQRQRFLSRLETPEKNWKFSAADIRERGYWDDYQKAFSEVLSNTSTKWAPWYVVPADRKWLARVVAGAVILETLMDINPRFPEVSAEAKRLMVEAGRELEKEGPRRPQEAEPVYGRVDGHQPAAPAAAESDGAATRPPRARRAAARR